MEDPTFSEMADYIDTRDDFFEKLSPPPSGGNGSKQVKKNSFKNKFLRPLQILYAKACMQLAGLSRHCTGRQHTFFRRNVAAVLKLWQDCVRCDRP